MKSYNIADLTFSLESQTQQADSPVWKKFSSDREPQLVYRVQYAQTLPIPDGEPFYADARVRCYETEQGIERVYSDLYTHRDTVHSVERAQGGAKHCDLTVSMARYPWGANAEQLYEVLNLPHYLLEHGRLLIHGAYIIYNGKAIIFTAPSGVGKSTQAELWRRHCGAQIVNGDRTLLGFEDGCLTAYGYPFSGSSEDCENVSCAVAAIVFLSQAKQNAIEPLRGTQAIGRLAKSIYLLPENAADLTAQLDFAVKTAQNVPIYHLACLPDESAVKLLRDTL